ncbi:MAG: pyridoxal-phosphate dependent enzyme [Chloroflexota bacterium]|nr:pyridoxal-phosphate dependent enzyme [Chloroflexota bacterium]
MTYLCPSCGHREPDDALVWCCPACQSHLNYADGPILRRADIVADERSLWRYEAALPIKRADAVAYFGEGMTALIPGLRGAAPFLLKIEYLLPSGSFKDRGSAVLVNALHQLGVREVVEDSSGNAGASLACYAARAGLDCEVYTPASTSPGKLAQIVAHGARLVRVPGSRDDTARAVQERAAQRFYASHNWQPLFVEGMKTLAFELWEQLRFRAPDAVVAPVGLGSALLGMFHGFSLLRQAGEIDRLPRLYACQASVCAPIHAAFQAGLDDIPAVACGRSIAEGVATSRPIRRREILAALRESGGGTAAADDDQIRAAQHALAAEGLYVEATAALALAGAIVLLDAGTLRAGETNVVLLCGSGLKQGASAATTT